MKSLMTTMMTCDTTIPSLDEIHYTVDEAANKLVGLKDAQKEMIELLTGGSKQLKIFSIVGMPGLGSQLVLKNKTLQRERQLEEIPSCFGEIPTVQLIEMKWCSSSARNLSSKFWKSNAKCPMISSMSLLWAWFEVRVVMAVHCRSIVNLKVPV
ncbi:hypothetical protein ACH5RR_034418 [Cinchona calisaya]|uniref:Uncharacterized protein n=1 Tax=Cinchona calisaya TaxID=153742 RepID=A0ABD2YDX8_9GENT